MARPYEPLYSSAEMRAAEERYPGYPDTIPELMERAGAAVAREAMLAFPAARSFACVCGGGSNGGDGRVAARALRGAGHDVDEATDGLDRYDVIVDALFGTGFSGAPRAEAAELIERMNGLKMLLDLSHANMQTMAEAVAASTAPVIVSHTACMAVHQNRRNTTDENLRAVANRGGVIGICQMRPFLTTKKRDNLHAYFDHLMHAIRVAGVEHVAIGSDRDHRVITLTPEYLAELRREEGSQVVDSDLPYFIDELNGPRRMTIVRDGLSRRGLNGDDVDRIMGLNVRRLYHEVVG